MNHHAGAIPHSDAAPFDVVASVDAVKEREPAFLDAHGRRPRAVLDRPPTLRGLEDQHAFCDLEQVTPIDQRRLERNVSDACALAIARRKIENDGNRGAAVDRRDVQHWAVIKREARDAVRRNDGLGEERGVFVVAARQAGRREIGQAQTFPRVAVVRDRERDARAVGSVGRVSHHVGVEQRDERDARIFAAISTGFVTHLVRGRRFERVADAPKRKRLAETGRFGDSDARAIPRPYHARIEQQFSVAIARRCRIEDALAFGFVVVGLEYDPEPLDRCVERRERKLIHHPLVYLRTVDAIVTPSGVTTSITEPVR